MRRLTLVVVLLVAVAAPASATTIYQITASTCHECWYFGLTGFPDVTIEAVVTTEAVTGWFYKYLFQGDIFGTFDSVVSGQATVNGSAFTVESGWFIEGFWYPSKTLERLALQGAERFHLLYQGDYGLLFTGTDYGGGNVAFPLTWSVSVVDTVAVPDTASTLFLLGGVFALCAACSTIRSFQAFDNTRTQLSQKPNRSKTG